MFLTSILVIKGRQRRLETGVFFSRLMLLIFRNLPMNLFYFRREINYNFSARRTMSSSSGKTRLRVLPRRVFVILYSVLLLSLASPIAFV